MGADTGVDPVEWVGPVSSIAGIAILVGVAFVVALFIPWGRKRRK